MSTRTKIYFASDLHLGIPTYTDSLVREKKFVRWLDQIKHDAKELYLVGDVFDFWFEYKNSIPKFYTRLFGKLAELSDSGIAIHYFTGNHDMWVFDYFTQELNIKIYHEPIEIQHGKNKLLIGHGDGLGPGDHGYKLIKKFFRSKLCQFLFAWIHPNIGISLANYWSRKSRKKNSIADLKYYGEEEWLLIYCKEQLQKNPINYFIFGHRHMPLSIELSAQSKYINLGDWIQHFTYAVSDGATVELISYTDN